MNGQGPFSHSCSFHISGRGGQVTSKDNKGHRFRESPQQEANPGVAGRSWVSHLYLPGACSAPQTVQFL